MASYVLSTNLFTFAQAERGFFGWPGDTGEGEIIRALNPDDVIVPKFSQASSYAGQEGHGEAQRRYCEELGLDYAEVLARYDETINGGENSVPYLLRVVGPPEEGDWVTVPIEVEWLGPESISTQTFLRLRALPPEIAAQFKATVAQGRHLQEVDNQVATAVRAAASSDDRTDLLRRYSVVEADSPEAAWEILSAAGRQPVEGDQVFIVAPGGVLGLHNAHASGLSRIGDPVNRTVGELITLFDDALTKARQSDYFSVQRTQSALTELDDLLQGPQQFIAVDDFGRFYDRYVLFEKKVTQALSIAARTAMSTETAAVELAQTEDEADRLDEAASLHGLTVDAVIAELPAGIELPRDVIAEAVTALRSGKHLLIGGPPGTGKSTLSEALCRAVMGNQYDVSTGTADWTTFDTIGGYVPSAEGLRFEPGIVLRALKRGAWVLIDELNRADIDKAFGPLFTLLAGTGDDQPNRRVVLPFRQDGKTVDIRWSQSRGTDDFVVTPTWRLIGTLNLADKATLFQLSFAFLRRFAVLNVPIPPPDRYRNLLSKLFSETPTEPETVEAFIECSLAISHGPREIGPAIMQDVASFVGNGLVETATGGGAYESPTAAFLTAIRLYVVPQYEGATFDEVEEAVAIIKDSVPDADDSQLEPLRRAFTAVALT